MKKLFFAALLLFSTVAAAETIEMKVNGLVCAFCAQGIEKTFRRNPAVTDVVVSLEDKLVALELKPGQDIADPELRKALSDSGYDVKAIERSQTSLSDIRARLKKAHP